MYLPECSRVEFNVRDDGVGFSLLPSFLPQGSVIGILGHRFFLSFYSYSLLLSLHSVVSWRYQLHSSWLRSSSRASWRSKNVAVQVSLSEIHFTLYASDDLR